MTTYDIFLFKWLQKLPTWRLAQGLQLIGTIMKKAHKKKKAKKKRENGCHARTPFKDVKKRDIPPKAWYMAGMGLSNNNKWMTCVHLRPTPDIYCIPSSYCCLLDSFQLDSDLQKQTILESLIIFGIRIFTPLYFFSFSSSACSFVDKWDEICEGVYFVLGLLFSDFLLFLHGLLLVTMIKYVKVFILLWHHNSFVFRSVDGIFKE